MSINAGSIYYTVDIDRASLQALKRTLRDVAESATKASAAVSKANAATRASATATSRSTSAMKKHAQALDRLSNKTANLSSKVKTANADYKNTHDIDAYTASMRTAGVSAARYREELEALLPKLATKPKLYKKAKAEIARLATIENQASDAAGTLAASTDKLDARFDELANSAMNVGAQMRRVDAGLVSGKLTAQQAEAAMRDLQFANARLSEQMMKLSKGLNLSGAELKRFDAGLGRVARNSKFAGTQITKLTGQMNQVTLSAQLSRGATSLLTDQIFQISPTVGIMLNSLQYATNGLLAFARAIAPVLLVAGSLIGVFATLAASLRAGSALEDALTDVRKTTNLATEDLDDLAQSFQETSKQIPIAVSELLDMAKVAGQLGITGANNIERFADTVARLSIATDVTGEQGATNLARFLQATGTAMEDMGQEAERVANVLNELENTTAATAAEILQMTSYTQGLASQANFTTEEILGINAALLSLGVKAEAGGSAIVRTMSKIQQASSEGGEEIAKFAEQAGVTVDEFDNLVRSSPLDALLTLANGMNSTATAGGNLNDVLTELGINEVRERRTLLALAQGYDSLEKAVYNARRESFLMNSLNLEVQLQSEKLSSRLIILRNTFVDMAQDIGKRLVPVAKNLIDLLIGLTQNTKLLTSAVIGLATALTVRGLIAAGSSLLAVFGRVRRVVGGLVATFAAVRTGAVALSFGLKAVAAAAGLGLGPVGWAMSLAVVLGGTAGLIAYFRQATEATDDSARALEEYKESVDTAVDALSRVENELDLKFAIESISATLTGLGKDAWDEYADKVIEQTGTITEKVQLLLAEYEKLALEPFRQNLGIAQADVALAAMEVERLTGGQFILKPDASVEGLRDFLAAIIDVRREYDPTRGVVNPTDVDSEIARQAESLDNLIGAVERLISARETLNKAIEDSPTSILGEDGIFGEGGAPSGRTDNADNVAAAISGASEFDPIQDILDRMRQKQAELELQFRTYGRISGESYADGIDDSILEAADSLISLLATPVDELAEKIQQAGGSIEGEFVKSIDQARAEAAELLARAGLTLEWYIAPEGPLTPSQATEYARRMQAILDGQPLRLALEMPDIASLTGSEARAQAATSMNLLDIESAATERLAIKYDEMGKASSRHRDSLGQLNREIESGIGTVEILSRKIEIQERYVQDLIEADATATTEFINARAALIELNAAMEQRTRLTDALVTSMDDLAAAGEDRAEIAANLNLLNVDLDLQEKRAVMLDKVGEAAQKRRDELSNLNDAVAAGIAPNNTLNEKIRIQQQYVQDLVDANAQNTREYENAVVELNALISLEVRHNEQLRSNRDALAQNAEAIDWNAYTVSLLTRQLSTLDASSEAYERTLQQLIATGGANNIVLNLLTSGASDYDEALAMLNQSGYANAALLKLLAERYAGVAEGERALSAARTTHAEGLRVLRRQLELGLITEEEFSDGEIRLYEALINSGIAANMSEKELQAYLKVLRELKEEQAEANKEVVTFGEAMLDIASSLRGVAGDFGSAARDIFDAFQTMTDGLDELDKEAKQQQIATGIASIVNSVSSLMPEYESAANQFVKATLTMAGAAIGFGVAGQGGAQAGAAIGGFFSKLFGDLSNGLKQIQEKVKETVASTNYLSKGLVDSIAKESTIRVSRGGMYGGTKAALDQEAYDAAIQAASSIAAGLAGALKTGIDGAIRGDKDWKKNMRDALKESMIEQITNSFIETTLSGGEFDEFIKKFTELLKSEDVGAAMDYFNEKYSEVVGKLDENTKEFIDGVGEAFKETLPEAIQRVYESAVDSVQFLSDEVVQNIIDNAVRRGKLKEELANQMISLADSIASGFASGLTKGINDAIMGERDWKKNLRESFRSTIMESVINAFVQTAILDGVFGNFFETITKKIQKGNTEGAMKYASKNIAELSEAAAQLIEEFVSSIDDELMPEPPDDPDDGGISRGEGAAISEITGPTRDLFLDLFRPLSILPSWTTMIRDIRNDVRSIASGGGFMSVPSVSLAQMSTASAPSAQNIIINNPIINTQATDAKQVYRDLSRYANKQKRGGK